MKQQPTYQKFEAASPQFVDVGRALYEHWFDAKTTRYKLEFSHQEIDTLLDYMWHNEGHYKSVIADKDKEIANLNKKIKELKSSGE